jgi:murein L,D-transpeptidase YcbB/YkuD
MYSTAVVMKNGEVHFFQDIYGRTRREDAALEKELAAQPHTPVTSGEASPPMT